MGYKRLHEPLLGACRGVRRLNPFLDKAFDWQIPNAPNSFFGSSEVTRRATSFLGGPEQLEELL